MVTVNYAAERAEVSQAQLLPWTGQDTGREMRLSGPCPACAHVTPAVVAQEFTALAVGAAPRALAVSLACACGQPHPGQPDGAAGCGRHWTCTATTGAGGQVALAVLSDPALEAAAEALRTAGATQLADVRSAAEKWIGGVTALFSLFGLAGVIVTRSTVAGMVTGWQVVVALTAAASLALAGLSVFRIYRAAYGWPVTRVIADNDELRNWYAERTAAPRVQAEFLRTGVRAAGAALVALVLALAVVWLAPQQQPELPMVQVTLTDGSQVCGTLLAATPGATLVRRASDGASVNITPHSIVALTVVPACS